MILFRYILRNHFVPFIFSVITLMGIFLLQFLMKFADRLVGKGIETWIIIQLIAFNLAWMVVLVVPMAVLIATLMAYGNMSQNNEITIIKSSGVSLYKLMLPTVVVSILLAYLMYVFNNDVLPDANHQAKLLGHDISRKKPTLSLEPGFFSLEVSNYAILARQIEQSTNELTYITIYDYSTPGKVNVVTAKRGNIYFSKDQSRLLMDLQIGEIHESDIQRTNLYRKLIFENHRITMNADQFTFQQTGVGTRGERELSIQNMNAIIDSLRQIQDTYLTDFADVVRKYLYADTSSISISGMIRVNVENEDLIYVRAVNKIKTTSYAIVSNIKRLDYIKGEIDKYSVEVHKKYSIPAACIIFILIGAPLGVMVRKGGFGVAASISLFFFLVYWAFLIGGEKLAERGFFHPFWGMWSANILLGAIGIFLAFRTNKESVVIDFSFLRKLVPKQWRNTEEISD